MSLSDSGKFVVATIITRRFESKTRGRQDEVVRKHENWARDSLVVVLSRAIFNRRCRSLEKGSVSNVVLFC